MPLLRTKADKESAGNGKDNVEIAIQRVLNKTCVNVANIIIDGASTDGIIDIIRKNDHVIAYCISERGNGF